MRAGRCESQPVQAPLRSLDFPEQFSLPSQISVGGRIQQMQRLSNLCLHFLSLFRVRLHY